MQEQEQTEGASAASLAASLAGGAASAASLAGGAASLAASLAGASSSSSEFKYLQQSHCAHPSHCRLQFPQVTRSVASQMVGCWSAVLFSFSSWGASSGLNMVGWFVGCCFGVGVQKSNSIFLFNYLII